MSEFFEVVAAIAVFLLVAALWGILLCIPALLTLAGWNYALTPALNGAVNPITFWQAFLLWVLAGVLFRRSGKKEKTTP